MFDDEPDLDFLWIFKYLEGACMMVQQSWIVLGTHTFFLSRDCNMGNDMRDLVGPTERCLEDGYGLSKLLAWLSCVHERLGEKERVVWIRGSKKSRQEQGKRAYQQTVHSSPHPAGIWRASKKLLPETCPQIACTHTITHTHTPTLPPSLSCHSFLPLWPHFRF